jgi:uncharacterized protein YkwD
MKTLKTFLLSSVLVLSFATSALANCGPAADRDPAAPGVTQRAEGHATLCLLNVERAKRGLHKLRSNRKLALAGLRHAQDMVRHRYFAHDALSGQDFVQRIMRTHYVPANSSWFLGENLAWGSQRASTPRQIVRAWMASPEHKRNILTRGFREIGIAIVSGAPVSGVGDAATYATEFGVVHRR